MFDGKALFCWFFFFFSLQVEIKHVSYEFIEGNSEDKQDSFKEGYAKTFGKYISESVVQTLFQLVYGLILLSCNNLCINEFSTPERRNCLRLHRVRRPMNPRLWLIHIQTFTT